jgi:hypothetical protein
VEIPGPVTVYELDRHTGEEAERQIEDITFGVDICRNLVEKALGNAERDSVSLQLHVPAGYHTVNNMEDCVGQGPYRLLNIIGCGGDKSEYAHRLPPFSDVTVFSKESHESVKVELTSRKASNLPAMVHRQGKWAVLRAAKGKALRHGYCALANAEKELIDLVHQYGVAERGKNGVGEGL